MSEKNEVSSDWPFETGDYVLGDVHSPVAVVTLGSNMNNYFDNSEVSIAGPLHTENLGIEKMVTNIISNPYIRYLIICGSEVQGHITGKTVEALYENGIDPEKKTILGSPGAIPFVENLPVEAVERFKNQIELISMIDNENTDEIDKKINECIENNPGPYDEEPMIIELNEKEEVEESTEENTEIIEENSNVDSSSINLLEIESRIRFMKAEINEIASLEKISSGYYAGKIEGIVIGFIITIILLIIIL